MLGGISDAEDAYLQRKANALERRMSRRRVNDPARTEADLRAALRRAGWVRISIEWLGTTRLLVNAEVGARLKAELCHARVLSADERLFGDFVGAARKVGLKPGIEDISVSAEGQRVEASVSAVPFSVTSAAVRRMVDHWRDRGR
ncbi:MAG: hypothetical protein NT154_47435 [Verrucomicrobia bacterium]|nr:hypothetical protein [Verrucomicrobiota bacterium]